MFKLLIESKNVPDWQFRIVEGNGTHGGTRHVMVMITLETTPDRVTVFRGHVRIADMAHSNARELQDALNALYPPEPFSLQLGGTYRARNGTLHGPLIHNANSDYAFASLQGVTWKASGHYMAPHFPDPLDLIERI